MPGVGQPLQSSVKAFGLPSLGSENGEAGGSGPPGGQNCGPGKGVGSPAKVGGYIGMPPSGGGPGICAGARPANPRATSTAPIHLLLMVVSQPRLEATPQGGALDVP